MLWKAPPTCSLSFHCEYWQWDNGPMAAPGIPRLQPRPGRAELELVLCPRTMGGTMGAGPASILLPVSLWGQRRPGFVLDCEGQCDGQSRGWCPARLLSAPLLLLTFLWADIIFLSFWNLFLLLSIHLVCCMHFLVAHECYKIIQSGKLIFEKYFFLHNFVLRLLRLVSTYITHNTCSFWVRQLSANIVKARQ